MKIFDVVVNSSLSKCEQLYNVLLMIDCQQLTKGVSYLRQAVKKRESRFIRYAYRICKDDNGMWFYHSFRNIDEVGNEISLTDFINIIKPERTVTL